MKTKNNILKRERAIKFINIIKSLLFIVILTNPLLSISQSPNNYEIELPDVDFTPSQVMDIISAGNFIYVYTMKNILIYEEVGEITTYQDKIDFGIEHGRFAPMYFDYAHYAADPALMAHDPTNHLLYFVTPELTIKSVNTLTLDTDPDDVSLPLQLNLDNRSLHGYTKLVYDKDRLFWLIRTMDNNLHSFDAYFGVFEKNIDGTWSDIYQESQNGSDTSLPDGDYWNLMSTFTVNTDTDINDPNINDFYMARKYKIEQWRINQGSANREVVVETLGQERNSKLLYVSSKKLLLAFPLALDDSGGDQHIYQINTQTFVHNETTMQLSPSKLIFDAIYIPENDDVLVCYGSENRRQISEDGVDVDGDEIYEPDHDVASYHFNSSPDQMIFTLSDLITTQSANEVDIYTANLNRAFKLTNDYNGNVLVSKKNDIVRLSDIGNLRYGASNVYYARDNFFGRGIVDPFGNLFILNTAISGFEKIKEVENNYVRQAPFKTAYPVYNTVYNHLNSQLYFFNRLGTENTGFFAYDLETESQTFVETSKAIGDLIYNPVNNHILVSEYAPADEGNARIRVYNANDFSSVTYTYPGDYPGRMFAAPNGKIYISLNMHADDNMPKIQEVDATTYNGLRVISSGLQSYPSENCNTFQSFYCYNPYNEKVYATFGPYYQSTDQPYQTSYNCGISTSQEPFENPTAHGGQLIIIDESFNIIRKPIERPNEIICSTPISQQNNQDYEGVLFINSNMEDGETLSDIHIFDCKNEEFITLPEGDTIRDVYDMDYCPLTGCLYAISHEVIVIVGEPDQKYMHVYKINEDGSYTNIMEVGFEGTASSINYNEFDGQLYIYDRGKYKMLGVNNAIIHTLDPFAESNAITESIALPYKNMFPEMVPQANHPHFNPYNNKAYFPNGMHSSVSVVGFEANEPLYLDPTVWNWVSFPRTEVPYPTSSVTVMTDNIQPFQVFESHLSNLPFGNDVGTEEYLDYDGQVWTVNQQNGLSEIFNVRGYKLSVDKDNLAERQLFLKGTVIDANTSISEDLNTGKDNWVGYWLYETQDVFDALADYEPDLTIIRAEKWTCFKDDQIYGPEAPWVCDTKNPFVKYGEMLILRTGVNITNFQWNHSGNPPESQSEASPEYFTFSPTDDYTPILIELDSTDSPQEIGAFIGDSCVGATVVDEGDTVVAMRTYLNALEGDSVIFEKYYGTKSTNHKVNTYFVYNKEKGMHEKRVINPKERKAYIRVSFKTPDNSYLKGDGDFQLRIFPNPTKGVVKLEYYLDKDASITIKVFDINGEIMQSLEIKKAKGKHNTTFDLATPFGNKPNPGIYLLQLSTGSETAIRKIVVE